MDELNYLDFDLRIARTAGGYRARVWDSLGREAAADFQLPMSELEDVLLRLAPPHRGAGRAEPEKLEAAKSFGGRLFEAVFHGEVLGCLRTSLEDAKGRKGGLRIRLRLTDAPELADLPWEYLYDPSRHRFLALSNKTPVVRYLELPERIPPLTVTPPLRVLVMLANPHDYAELDVEQEWRQLDEALSGLKERGLVELERLAGATLEALRRRLRQGEVHVLHFIGHGGFSEDSQEGVVILEDEGGQGHRVRSEVLAVLLHDHAPLRLVVLNVCEGARASRGDPFAGVAQTLIRQGIPAVVAMQSEVTDETALTLAHQFYRALADGYPVDASLTEARKAVFSQGNVEWGTPVLCLRAPDGRIFDTVSRFTGESSSAGTPPPARPHPGERILIAYAQKDADVANLVVKTLEEIAPVPAIDRTEVSPGESFTERICEGATKASYVALLVSPTSAASGWISPEWLAEQAAAETVVLPVLVADCELPPALRGIVFTDLRSDPAAGLARLRSFFEHERQAVVPTADDNRDSGRAHALRSASRRILRLVAQRCMGESDLEAFLFDADIDGGRIPGRSLHERIIYLLVYVARDDELAEFAEWLALEPNLSRCVSKQLKKLEQMERWP